LHLHFHGVTAEDVAAILATSVNARILAYPKTPAGRSRSGSLPFAPSVLNLPRPNVHWTVSRRWSTQASGGASGGRPLCAPALTDPYNGADAGGA